MIVNLLKQVYFLIQKDLLLEWRQKYAFNGILLYVVSTVVVVYLAFMDIEAGETDAALDRLQAIIEDASVSTDLQQRALQVMVALGGTPELQTLPDLEN